MLPNFGLRTCKVGTEKGTLIICAAKVMPRMTGAGAFRGDMVRQIRVSAVWGAI